MALVRAQFRFAVLWITLILMETEFETKSLNITIAPALILPYWKRESTPDSRRINSLTLSNEVDNNVLDNNLYRRNEAEKIAIWSSHEKDAKQVPKKRPEGSLIKSKYHNVTVQSKQMNFLTEPKQKHLRATEEVRSTRIAPLHLAQNNKGQQGPLEPYDVKLLKDDSELFILNPYSVEKQFTRLLSEFEEAEFTTEVLGRTASYLDIVLFKIEQRGKKYFRGRETKYVETETKDRKILFIVHALSPMGLGHLYSLTLESHLKILISYYLAYIDKFDIYLIPMANPDGYTKAKKNIFWNKNVVPNTACPGVDVDRNFDVAWNITKTEASSCSQHYPGETPFSEPESRAVRDIFHRMSHKIVAYFHVHGASYTMDTYKGDAVLYPKGYTDHQSDDDKYIDLKGEIDEAMKNSNFKAVSVTVDTLYNWYGKVSGSSVDYAASVYGIPYAMELVMQLYQDNYETHFDKTKKAGLDFTSVEFYSLAQIWKRVIDVIFTNIHKKLEASDAARKR